jgi:low affinity Fe/Cu permease
MQKKDASGFFHVFARATSRAAGKPAAFVIATLLILAWALSGPIFGFSNTWQLVVNTATTICTFLMVFLIQHTQNRDAETTQLKLAELIRATKGAKNSLVDLEGLSDEELEALEERYRALAAEARERRASGEYSAAADDDDEEEERSPYRAEPGSLQG